MLKKRIAGLVIVRDGIAVQSIGFRKCLPIGKPEIVVEYLNSWGADEIAIVDITAGRIGKPNFEMISRVSAFCQVPLTYGGGIWTADDMVSVIQAGADKLMINSVFFEKPELVMEGALRLGNQCIIVAIDALRSKNDSYVVYRYRNGGTQDSHPAEWAEKAQKLGAGEIFLNSVDHDGCKQGLDLRLVASVAERVKVPLIVCGGIGHPTHFEEGLKVSNVSAVAAGNYFNFTEHSVATTKGYLIHQFEQKLRSDTSFNYSETSFVESGRIAKKADRVLKESLFEYHPKEVI